jgi:hypothetical protein
MLNKFTENSRHIFSQANLFQRFSNQILRDTSARNERETLEPRRIFPLLLLAVLCFFCFSVARAQSNRGTLSGTVLDSSGAAIPNAKVTAVETSTNSTYTAKSSQQGSFTFPQVLVGSYTITAVAPDFKTQQQTGIQVLIGTTSTATLSLVPGNVS